MSDHDEILEFCKQRDVDLIKNDAEAIAAHMAAGWAYITPVGALEKNDIISRIKSGSLQHQSMVFFEMPRISVHGDTAVVTGRKQSVGIDDGTPYSTDEWLTEVLIRRDGQWKCILSQKTPIFAPEASPGIPSETPAETKNSGEQTVMLGRKSAS